MAINKLKKKIGVGRHTSSIKRARQTPTRHARNKHTISMMRGLVKKVRTTGSKDDLAKAIPLIARTASKGIIPKKRASRLISRLTKTTNAK